MCNWFKGLFRMKSCCEKKGCCEEKGCCEKKNTETPVVSNNEPVAPTPELVAKSEENKEA